MLIGKRINERYKILELIGGGGMSHVYLAHDMILNRQVAIKVLRYDFTNEEELHRRFKREALAATSLTHPNIVNIYDVGDDGNHHFIVMEYINGKTLKQYIQEFSPVEPAKAVQIMKQLTSAITHAHDHQIVHRDIKPQNILMDQNGNVKITDFGIATTLSATSYTKTNSVIGTVHYLSPEQARGGVASYKSDIYALGIVLYELLTGELPFSGDSAVSIALKHLQSETPSVREINAAIPQSLENVVIRATAKDPRHRYESVMAMEEDLNSVLSVARMNEPKFFVPSDDIDATKVIPIIKDVPKSIPTKKPIETEEAVKAPAKQKNKKSKTPFIIAGAILLLVIILTMYLFLNPSKVAVPEVVDLTLEEATTLLEKEGFVVGDVTERYDEEVEVDKVIESNPKAGMMKVKGSEIDLVVSLGMEQVEMDNYVGQQIEQVQSLLENQDLKIEIEEVYSSSPAGEIIEQTPEAGTKIVPEDTTITFKVSQGLKIIEVSNLTSYTQAALKDYEKSSGLVVKIVKEDNSDTISAGGVISQSPKAGAKLNEGDTVEVVISKGPAEKISKIYFQDVTIQYSPLEEGETQRIKVYIEDKTHSILDVYEEFDITENKTYRIQLDIVEGSKAAYQILRDDTLIMKETIPYDRKKD